MRWVQIILFINLLGSLPMYSVGAQPQVNATDEIRKFIESLVEEFDTEEESAGTLLHFLIELSEHPLNINQAGLQELLQIPWIDMDMARNIINYRKAKPFEELIELKNVKGIGEATYSKIRFFLRASGREDRFQDLYRNPQYWFGNNRTSWMSRYQQTLEKQEGYLRPDSLGGYLGSAAKYYQRFSMSSRHLSLNLMQEKDPGEKVTMPVGFDMNSFHLAIHDNGRLKELVLGDFEIKTGQGLVFGGGGGFGKGTEVIEGTYKREQGLKPYRSSEETGFFRGLGVTYGNTLQSTVFYSVRQRTASILNENIYRFPSKSGFHRTVSEEALRFNLKQITTGGRVSWLHRYGKVGASGYYNEFDHPIGGEGGQSSMWDFSGRENHVLGLDFDLGIEGFRAFGEWAKSHSRGTGYLVGVQRKPGGQTKLSLLYRSYATNFHSFFGSGFGEYSSAPQNEKGWYMGMEHQLCDRIHGSFYLDSYRSPVARNSNTQPSAGMDFLGYLEFKLTETEEVQILYRDETKGDTGEAKDSFGRPIKETSSQRRSKLRLQLETKPMEELRLRTRLEFVRSQLLEEPYERGILIYQDMQWQPSRSWKFNGRITFFDTDGFDARVYQFENDLLYVLRNTMLTGEGERMYLVVNYEMSDQVELWFKYSSSLYEDRLSVGTALSEIKGNRRRDIGMQVRVRFN